MPTRSILEVGTKLNETLLAMLECNYDVVFLAERTLADDMDVQKPGESSRSSMGTVRGTVSCKRDREGAREYAIKLNLAGGIGGHGPSPSALCSGGGSAP